MRLAKLLAVTVVACGYCVLGGSTARAALTLVDVPTTVTASENFAGFEPTKLFDATVTLASIGQDSKTFGGGAFASNSTSADPVVYMTFATTITADSFAYAQRQGAGGGFDKAASLEFWFESSLPASPNVPVRAPDETVTLLDTGANLATLPFRLYNFVAPHTSQFVVMRVNNFDAGRPGGNELRLANVPEPGSAGLLAAGLLGLLVRRRSGIVAAR